MISHFFTAPFFSVRKKIRTPDLLIRSQTLYPAELCAHLYENEICRSRQHIVFYPIAEEKSIGNFLFFHFSHGFL